ncbi:MAG: hypothetical protein ACK58J_00090, partial [Planctomyces sp.]
MHSSRFLLCFLLLSATTAAQELTDADKALIQKVQEAGEETLKAANAELQIVPDFRRDREREIAEAGRAAE